MWYLRRIRAGVPKPRLDRSALYRRIGARVGLPAAQVREALTVLSDVIRADLPVGTTVSVPGICKLRLGRYRSGPWTNPVTGLTIQSQCRKIRIKPSRILLRRIADAERDAEPQP